MILCETIEELDQFLSDKDGTCGFVPTMGALHDGHISLVNKARAQSDFVIVSIFVNPTQFNDKNDLHKYPRTLEADAALLQLSNVDVLFAPKESVIYPKGLDTDVDIDLGMLDKVMEGKHRPGHFSGVMEVVKRLLEIVKPDYLYMGQKDFQQFTIIQHMIDYFEIKTELIVCPIQREAHGLARSSRNERLNPQLRESASIIHKVLQSIKRRYTYRTLEELTDYAKKKLNNYPFELEYISFVDGNTLQDVSQVNDTDYLVCCIVVWAYNDKTDGVRLIDNMILKKK